MNRRVTAGAWAALGAAMMLALAPVEAQTGAQTGTPIWTNVTGSLAYKVSECGTLTLLSAVPDSNAIIAGIAARGLWVNTGGTTWARLTDGSETDRILNRPSWIVYDPENPAIFWESGIYNGPGVYQTIDGGKTFVRLGEITHNDYVSVDFADPERRTLLAGGHETSQMVHMSLDAGKTWRNVGRSMPAGSGATTHPFVVDALTFLVNVATPMGSPLVGIYRSKDGGDSWQRVSPHGPPGPPLRTADGALYWTVYNRLLRSIDRGATWNVIGIEGLRPIRPVELPGGGLAAVGQSTLVLSLNGGASWAPVGAPLPYTPDGLVSSAQRKAFFIWRGDCREHVPANAVMMLEFNPATTPPRP